MPPSPGPSPGRQAAALLDRALDAPSVIVANLGLHYNNHADYESHLTRVVELLAAFSLRHARNVVILLETSAQVSWYYAYARTKSMSPPPSPPPVSPPPPLAAAAAAAAATAAAAAAAIMIMINSTTITIGHHRHSTFSPRPVRATTPTRRRPRCCPQLRGIHTHAGLPRLAQLPTGATASCTRWLRAPESSTLVQRT